MTTPGVHVGAPVPENDWQRVEALRQLNILDTPDEESFSAIVKACSQAFEVCSCMRGRVPSRKCVHGRPPFGCTLLTARPSCSCAGSDCARLPGGQGSAVVQGEVWAVGVRDLAGRCVLRPCYPAIRRVHGS